ncbi:hypothetical protein [Micromonospora chersina]|uniref:hypothetical protein n=1 Tax=Micromonospora chersina TaxID=47854 RepID=UPI0036C8539F
MRRVAFVCVVALALLSGCAGGSSAQPASSGTPAGADRTTGAAGAAGLPSGIVVVKEDFATRTKTLLVYDITTGKLLASAAAPAGADVDRREAFDATMHRLAYVTDCEMQVATLTEGAYVPSGRWQPPQAFGAGKQCFGFPTFGEDGRLRATIGATASEPGRVVSVDPVQDGAPPSDEGVGGLRQEKTFRIAGLTESDVRADVRGDTITGLTVTGVKPGGDVVSDDFWYDCDTRLDKTAFLCVSHGSAGQYYGSVALATLDVPAGTVTVKQVAPASKTPRATVLPAPDHKRVAIHDSTGWYTTSLDGASTPARQPLSDQQDIGDILFWG